MSVVCGTTAGAADPKISNRPVTFVSQSVRIEFESDDSNSNGISKLRRSLVWPVCVNNLPRVVT